MDQIEAVVSFKSLTALSQGKPVATERESNEPYMAHEERTWRERIHVDPETGNVFIPGMAFYHSLVAAARYRGDSIPGKGKKTYTKYFETSILVVDNLITSVEAAKVASEKLFVPSDGKPGSGSRVWKIFPFIPAWEGTLKFYVMDPTVTREVFEKHLVTAGMFIGVGRFRPERRGFYGRYRATNIEWRKTEA